MLLLNSGNLVDVASALLGCVQPFPEASHTKKILVYKLIITPP